MVGLFKELFAFLSRLVDYLRNKQMLDAGAAKEATRREEEANAEVELAKRADTVRDDERTGRLRSKYDRDSTDDQ